MPSEYVQSARGSGSHVSVAAVPSTSPRTRRRPCGDPVDAFYAVPLPSSMSNRRVVNTVDCSRGSVARRPCVMAAEDDRRWPHVSMGVVGQVRRATVLGTATNEDWSPLPVEDNRAMAVGLPSMRSASFTAAGREADEPLVGSVDYALRQAMASSAAWSAALATIAVRSARSLESVDEGCRHGGLRQSQRPWPRRRQLERRPRT